MMNDIIQSLLVSSSSEPASATPVEDRVTWVIVSQVKSNRVVYFTNDPDYQPPMEGDWYYCSTYQGALPEGMTLRNCWGWRFNGGVFADVRETPKQSTRELLLDNNRKALLRILRDKINTVREPFLPTCAHGEAVRNAKLHAAQAYLENPDSLQPTDRLSPLQAVAVARHISLLEAAELIVAKAGEVERVLLETERFREQLTQAIQSAQTEAQLLELREWLLDQVYPELTRQFKFRVENTEPPNLDALLQDTQRLHEIARLKVELREAINKKRAPIQSDYIQNDEIRKHKARLAQALLANNGIKQDGVDYRALEAYAEGRNLSLLDAAQLLVNSMAVAADLLVQTERVKDRMLSRIEAAKTLRDIQAIEKELEAL